MSPHAPTHPHVHEPLTHNSVSPHAQGAYPLTPGSGREGKGRGRGGESPVESLHSIKSVTREAATDAMPMDSLFDPDVTAHCFWWPRCKHTETDRPNAVHDAMEAHYDACHREDIAKTTWGRS